MKEGSITYKQYSEINYELGRIQGLVEGFDTECVIADNVYLTSFLL